MKMIDHNEILFRSKNDNFLDGRQVFNLSGVPVYPVNVCKGQNKFDNGDEYEHIWRMIGSLFRHFSTQKKF